MPQDEKFWNPYRLVPMKGDVQRKPPITDEKFQCKSGLISCSLENLTPLFIGKNRLNEQQFLTRKCFQGDRLVIPGSSLKGMFRSLGELIGGGCLITGKENKDACSPCSNANSLCITCRMFGMMERGRNARVHRGNLGISDGLLQEQRARTETFQVLLSNCGVRHEPFYRSPHTGILDGKSRKIYFHQPRRAASVPNVPDNLKPRAWKINGLLPNHHFDFEVQFSNLSEKELSLLIYVLVLEEDVNVTVEGNGLTLRGPLRHKIGSAKPLGMGSCHITINKLTYLSDPKERYASLQRTGAQHYEDVALRGEINRQIEMHVNDRSPTMEGLRKMMVWDESDPRDFRYPDYYWFKDPKNSQKELKRL